MDFVLIFSGFILINKRFSNSSWRQYLNWIFIREWNWDYKFNQIIEVNLVLYIN